MITHDKAYGLQEDFIKRIQNKKVLSKILSFEYAVLLTYNTPHLFAWGKINRMILERYKKEGLEKIREAAWKIHEQWTEAEQTKKRKINKIRW